MTTVSAAAALHPMSEDFLFTSESVGEGHPDKLCDQVSDSIVDLYLSRDTYTRCAVECAATTDNLFIIGETRSAKPVTIDEINNVARATIQRIGYDQVGFSYKTVNITNLLHEQSADIAVGVDAAGDKDEGAGDQGIMFGYAGNETPAFMPAPIYYAHEVLRRLSSARHSGKIVGIEPDAKSQFTLQYRNGKPVKAASVVLSTQHAENLSQSDVREIVRPFVRDVLPDGWMCAEDKFYVNPTGRFVIGGPVGDSGLTGRKIIVDTYGGAAPHGGGAFSGKDPTKVDRSAAYAARYLAKNIVAAGYTQRCTIQLSYAIGIAQPLSIYVNGHDTATVPEEEIVAAITKIMDLSPRGIRTHLALNRPIYARTAAYGHFGRTPEPDGGFSWEKLDLVQKFQDILG